MKATELMLRDWVEIDGKPRQLSCLIEGQDARNGSPIPITEEILKVNGFYHDGSILATDGFTVKSFSLTEHEEIWLYIEKEYIDLRITADTKEGIIIHYVHQLQQILRICGLRDIANNFRLG